MNFSHRKVQTKDGALRRRKHELKMATKKAKEVSKEDCSCSKCSGLRPPGGKAPSVAPKSVPTVKHAEPISNKKQVGAFTGIELAFLIPVLFIGKLAHFIAPLDEWASKRIENITKRI